MDHALQDSGYLRLQSCRAPNLLSLPSGTWGRTAEGVFEVGCLHRDVRLWGMAQVWTTLKNTCFFLLAWVTKLQV